MGKSTTARMFAAEGVPVFDADAEVHRLYGRGADGARAIRQLVPAAMTPSGDVDRAILAEAVKKTPELLARIEQIIHPLVAFERGLFRRYWQRRGVPFIVMDIPLLFETRADSWLDQVIVVSAPGPEQRRRVLARPGMTEEKLQMILARQMPDAQKRRRADWVIETGRGMAAAARAVSHLRAHLVCRHRWQEPR